MNTAGCEEALHSALRIELEPGLDLAAASLPGMAILKILAWSEGHDQSNRDAAGRYTIRTSFDVAGKMDRIYDEGADRLESAAYDLTLAGAHLVGRDAAEIADSATRKLIANVLSSEDNIEALVRQMARPLADDRENEAVLRFPGFFRRGFPGRSA